MRFRYTSVPSIGMTGTDYGTIAETAARRNAELGVTGALRFDGSRFFQEIEGGAGPIALLVGIILSDRRHRDISVEMLSRVDIRTHDKFTAEGFGAG